jgi:hypothetical protein
MRAYPEGQLFSPQFANMYSPARAQCCGRTGNQAQGPSMPRRREQHRTHGQHQGSRGGATFTPPIRRGHARIGLKPTCRARADRTSFLARLRGGASGRELRPEPRQLRIARQELRRQLRVLRSQRSAWVWRITRSDRQVDEQKYRQRAHERTFGLPIGRWFAPSWGQLMMSASPNTRTHKTEG